MKNKNLVSAITGIALFLIYNNAIAQSATPGLPALKKTIQKTNKIYFDLFAKRSLSIVSLYTDDARLLAPNMPPISGKQALTKDFADTFAAGKVEGVKFLTGEIYGDGKSFVAEEGTWQVFGPQGKPLDNGKYLKLWKKTKAGWKIFRDSFNSDR